MRSKVLATARASQSRRRRRHRWEPRYGVALADSPSKRWRGLGPKRICRMGGSYGRRPYGR